MSDLSVSSSLPSSSLVISADSARFPHRLMPFSTRLARAETLDSKGSPPAPPIFSRYFDESARYPTGPAVPAFPLHPSPGLLI